MVDLTPEREAAHENRCRLCGGDLSALFARKVRARNDVEYLRCAACGSLQTERPYWLAEAYAGTAAPLDMAALTRAMAVRAFTLRILDLVAIPRRATLLDWGAGNGILTRLLADGGLDVYGYDKHVRSAYTADRPPPTPCDVVTAFEVGEHFSDPAVEIDGIFPYSPRLHIVSTELHQSQNEDWPYLHPVIGRHVFFYSQEALRYVARRHGYELFCGSRFAVFTKLALEADARGTPQALLDSPGDYLRAHNARPQA